MEEKHSDQIWSEDIKSERRFALMLSEDEPQRETTGWNLQMKWQQNCTETNKRDLQTFFLQEKQLVHFLVSSP